MHFTWQVIEGYEIACRKAHEILPSLVCCSAKNLRDVDEVASLLHTSIMSKQYGNEAFLAKLIAQACGESGSKITCLTYGAASSLSPCSASCVLFLNSVHLS